MGSRARRTWLIAIAAAIVSVSCERGVGCGVCLDVGRTAMQKYNSGANLWSIRAAIDGQHRSSFPTMTPTPPVPK